MEDPVAFSPKKRRKQSPLVGIPKPIQHDASNALYDEKIQEQQDFWSNGAFFAIDAPALPDQLIKHVPAHDVAKVSPNPRKRGILCPEPLSTDS